MTISSGDRSDSTAAGVTQLKLKSRSLRGSGDIPRWAPPGLAASSGAHGVLGEVDDAPERLAGNLREGRKPWVG